jgi:hypothetical protein
MMGYESEMLTREEFASLLTVGNTCAVLEPPPIIPAEHSARLIALGYMADLYGRLRMTASGRSRIAAGLEKQVKGVKTGQETDSDQNGPLSQKAREGGACGGYGT